MSGHEVWFTGAAISARLWKLLRYDLRRETFEYTRAYLVLCLFKYSLAISATVWKSGDVEIRRSCSCLLVPLSVIYPPVCRNVYTKMGLCL